MALFEFVDRDGKVFRRDLTLRKATELADVENLKFIMIHGGTSGHGEPGSDF
tara:strand:+ start:90 stop:245 length:156 start_codon:yes stop_codon:yes gene_type:complete